MINKIIILFILLIIILFYLKLTKEKFTEEINKNFIQLDNSDGNDWISKKFEEGKPFIVGRLGSAESCLVSQYLNNKEIEACGEPHSCSGIYPVTQDMLYKFSEIYMKSLLKLNKNDAMLTFSNIKKYEDKIFPKLKFSTIMKNRAVEPFYFDDPWSKHLKGKTVLIIHGFIPSIKCQLKRYKYLFNNKFILPEFKPKFIQMPQCLGGKTPHKSYVETLNVVKDMIDKIGKFDVSIIAAGGYAMPLAVHCKTKHNSISIVMGGGSQIMFGLKGHRWDNHAQISKLYNKYWMYPLEEDTPDNAETIEMGGPYWGAKTQRLKKCPI